MTKSNANLTAILNTLVQSSKTDLNAADHIDMLRFQFTDRNDVAKINLAHSHALRNAKSI